MIARQSGYVLRKIGVESYLLPYGQRIADQKHGMRLNETGAALWELLDVPRTEEELSCLLAAQYGMTEEEYPELEADVKAFTEQLCLYGVLRETDPVVEQPFFKMLEIAGLKIALYGDASWFPKDWDLFAVEMDKKAPDTVEEVQEQQCWTVMDDVADQRIELIQYYLWNRQNGTVLLQNQELIVMQTQDGYRLDFPPMKNVKAVELSEDGRRVRMYVLPEGTGEYRENIFHAVRHCFLYLAQKRGLYAIHSASLLYKGRAWLFSGHSGVGKSTHTNLWKELFQTPVLNGDLNLVGEENGKMMIYGIPWCGTSGICTKECHPLGGIVLLAQDAQNSIQQLTKEEKILKVMQRMISPAWQPKMLDRNLAFAGKIAEVMPVCGFGCTKEAEAAKYLKEKFVDIK